MVWVGRKKSQKSTNFFTTISYHLRSFTQENFGDVLKYKSQVLDSMKDVIARALEAI